MVDFRGLRGTCNFYFVRHGESEGNRDRIIQGRAPSRLTEKGREQAREAGEWFRTRALDAVLTSPLARAEETARIIAEAAGVADIFVAEELIELDTGIFTGMSFEDAQRRFPVEYESFRRESWEAVPEAERIQALLARAGRAWNRAFALAGEGMRNVLSVTHSGFLQWILKSSLGGASWMPLLAASDNCCISHLRVSNGEQGGGEGGYLASWMLVNAPPCVDGGIAGR